MQNMALEDGRLVKLHQKLVNCITIISEFCYYKLIYISNRCNLSLDIIFSLRTSETNYLNEAFSFYSAIRARGYYSKVSKEERSDLMVKKLRYYARFIVVCLLLKKMKLVCDLVKVSTF